MSQVENKPKIPSSEATAPTDVRAEPENGLTKNGATIKNSELFVKKDDTDAVRKDRPNATVKDECLNSPVDTSAQKEVATEKVMTVKNETPAGTKTTQDEVTAAKESAMDAAPAKSEELSEKKLPLKKEVPEKSLPTQKKDVSEKSLPNQKKEVPEKSLPNQKKEVPEKSLPNQKKEVSEKSLPNQKKEVPEKSLPNQKKEVPEKSVPAQKKEVPEKSVPVQKKESPEKATSSDDIESPPKKAPTKQRSHKKAIEQEDGSDAEEEELPPGTLEQPVLQTGKRERKKVERLSMATTYSSPAEKIVEVPEGKGSKLGDIPRVELFISKFTAEDLKPLHRVLYGLVGKATLIKKNVRKFCGFTFDSSSAEYSKKKAVLARMTITHLKHICEVLDLERSGTKNDYPNRILEFLLDPKSSGKKMPIKKRKRSSNADDNTKRSKRAKTDDDDCSGDQGSSGDEDEAEDENGHEQSGDEDDGSDDQDSSEKKGKKKPKPVTKSKAKKETKKKESTKKIAQKRKKGKDDGSDDDVSAKKKRSRSVPPTDDEIKETVKRILEGANLEEVTMKTVCKQVYDKYPEHDLLDRKDFIKSTVKSLIS